MIRFDLPISDVLMPVVISCTAQSSLAELLKILRRNGILSVPVRADKSDSRYNGYIGRFGVWDIAQYIIRNQDLEVSLKKKIIDIWPSAVGDSVEDKKALMYGPGGLESLYTFNIDTKIDVLLKTFSKDIHTVLLTHWIDGHENIIRNFSQSDLIRSLYFNKNLLDKKFRRKKLNQLNVITRPVFTVKMSENIVDVLKMMNENHIMAVAVLEDTTDRLRTTFSVSDLRGLKVNYLPNFLHSTVRDFLTSKTGNIRHPAIVDGNCTLQETIRRLIWDKVHRLWEVDADMRVTGVVSLTDIIRVVASAETHIQ